MPKYVIIGGSAGAIGAVEAIREVDSAGTLEIIAEEPFLTYSKPTIGEYLSGEATLEKITYRNDGFWSENKVRILAGRKAVGVNFADKYVELDGGERIEFEKLLIATGSKPFIPEMEGADKRGVFSFTTLADAEGIKMRIEEAKRAVVVGGGLIGVCVAEALVKRGLEVTIAELKERILSLLLDRTASDIVAKAVRSRGVNIITGHTVQRIVGKNDDSTVGAAVLDNGGIIQCDMVVMAIGVRPRTELVLGTEVKVDGGIVVDRFMRTNIPSVYACGDVTESYDFIYGGRRNLPQWPTALLGGRVAGYNMAGKKAEYPGGTVMSALKYFDVPVIAVGMTNQGEGEGYEVLGAHDSARALYKKVVLKDGAIKGFILVRDIEGAGIMFYLMRNGIDVGDFKEKLLTEGFGLVSLPEWLRRKMLVEERAQ
jgi:NAD(P)H-nitrite reductase large subunit